MDSNYVNDPNVGNRLVVLLTNNSLSQKDREFVTSLQTTWNRFSQLTKRQYDYFEVVEKRYDPVIVAQVQQERQRWFDVWDDDKKLRFNLCCEYYSVTPYFRDIAAKGLVDKTFIPTEKQYRAMCENNYAKRLYENMTTRNFDDGEVIQYRGKNTYRGDLVGTVVTALDKITSQSANIGGRQYRVMWMTTGEEEIVLEKNIKKYRGK
jgi:hypothetical protein